ncbi:caspase family protein, partial [Stenotrophomonas maltophilia]|uniref:caspase family protein n=1 Tax=Stenotrophomonas maltophilia TaxID=40324 RepID=UPI001952DB74
MRKILLALTAICSIALTSHEALADKRVALVIGNSSYKNAPALTNPARDATAIADMLRKAEFDV